MANDDGIASATIIGVMHLPKKKAGEDLLFKKNALRENDDCNWKRIFCVSSFLGEYVPARYTLTHHLQPSTYRMGTNFSHFYVPHSFLLAYTKEKSRFSDFFFSFHFFHDDL